MSSIPEYMTAKHRECDDFFAEAESAVVKNDWATAASKFSAFVHELTVHLQAEENILFPQFEQATGMTTGPTYVMRGEHEQMRALVSQLEHALTNQEKDNFLGFSETLMILMQQHNMKEEMMLYPMSQQHIPAATALVDELKQHCEAP